jgi:peptidoglycan/xylan/chitin deacetylase (PgdA/CDA1 family)
VNIKSCVKSAIQIMSGHMAFKWPRRPAGVYCFNYHRIGDATATEFDPNLFSCDGERFEKHLKFFQQNFDVVSIDELIALRQSGDNINGRLAVVTFDDGYIDNYQIAYPILKSAGISAGFFVPTNYIDSPTMPWWDEVGWLVRHATASTVKLANWSNPVNIVDGPIRMRVRRLLRAIKQDNSISMDEKLQQLKAQLQPDTLQMPAATNLFINWTQLKEMAGNGMHIGSHTLSHSILSHLSVERQLHELTQSKLRLETMLERPVLSVAYPVGGADSFNDDTQKLAQQAGYELAFSFISGINLNLSDNNCFQLRRFPVDDNASDWQLKQLINNHFSI